MFSHHPNQCMKVIHPAALEIQSPQASLGLNLNNYHENWVSHQNQINSSSRTIVIARDFGREWNLTTVDPQERSTWRSCVRSALRVASQLPGRGPTDDMI